MVTWKQVESGKEVEIFNERRMDQRGFVYIENVIK